MPIHSTSRHQRTASGSRDGCSSSKSGRCPTSVKAVLGAAKRRGVKLGPTVSRRYGLARLRFTQVCELWGIIPLAPPKLVCRGGPLLILLQARSRAGHRRTNDTRAARALITLIPARIAQCRTSCRSVSDCGARCCGPARQSVGPKTQTKSGRAYDAPGPEFLIIKPRRYPQPSDCRLKIGR